MGSATNQIVVYNGPQRMGFYIFNSLWAQYGSWEKKYKRKKIEEEINSGEKQSIN